MDLGGNVNPCGMKPFIESEKSGTRIVLGGISEQKRSLDAGAWNQSLSLIRTVTDLSLPIL